MNIRKIFGIAAIIVGLATLLAIGVSYIDYKFNCYTETRFLTDMYIGSTNLTHGGNCSNGCLFMETVKAPDALDFYSGNYENEFREYLYFADEYTLRDDLTINSSIYVTWCKTGIGERVRGVK